MGVIKIPGTGGIKVPNVLGRGYKTIPHESAGGQTAFFKPGAEGWKRQARGVIKRGLGGLISKPVSPPFVSKGYGYGDTRARVMGLARTEELSQKAKLAARKAEAKRYGPMTEVEYVDALFGMRK
jgi:hypothetical protein